MIVQLVVHGLFMSGYSIYAVSGFFDYKNTVGGC